MIELVDPINPEHVARLLKQAQDAIDMFDQQVSQVPYVPYPVEIYELITSMADTISEYATVRKELTPEMQHNKFAIDELTDRLSDALSENIELSVQLRVYENQKAADEFIDNAIKNLFNPKDPQ